MYKDYELSVSPGVTASAPTEYIKTFPPCIIDRVRVTFKKGPNGEVYTKIMHEGEHIFPQDPEEWTNGEDEQVVMQGPWSNWDNLYQLRILLCSPDARISHNILFRFELSELMHSPPLGSAFYRLRTKFLEW